MSNQLAVNYDDRKIIETIKRTVARGVTDVELEVFLQFCKSMNLNPFKKEVWCISTRQGAQIMTGINGYLAIANSHKSFDGMEVDTSFDKSGQPVESVCKLHRKDRKLPSVGRARWKEDSLTTPIWRSKPTLMLEKVAKSRAIREAFPQELNGTYTEDEMPQNYTIASKVIQDAEVIEEPKVVEVEAVGRPEGYDVVYDVLSNCDKESARHLYRNFEDKLYFDPETTYWHAKEPIKELSMFQIEPIIEEIPEQKEKKPYDDPALDFIGAND